MILKRYESKMIKQYNPIDIMEHYQENIRSWENEDQQESTLTDRKVTIITQMLFCSKSEVLIDLKTFCRLIISENRLDKDNGFYRTDG